MVCKRFRTTEPPRLLPESPTTTPRVFNDCSTGTATYPPLPSNGDRPDCSTKTERHCVGKLVGCPLKCQKNQPSMVERRLSSNWGRKTRKAGRQGRGVDQGSTCGSTLTMTNWPKSSQRTARPGRASQVIWKRRG